MKQIIKHLLIFSAFSSFLFAQTKVLEFETYEKELPFGLTTQAILDYPQIGLALSGGGSRSLSQIGVLRALEEGGVPFDIVVGTSMGSIIGGLYSVGYSVSDLDSIISSANWVDFMSANETDRNELFIDQKITEDKAIFALRVDGLTPVLPTSLSTGQKISNFFTLLSLNAPIHVIDSFNPLYKKYRAVTTDLISGNMVVLERGSLSQAMRASSSVSFLLSPVKIDSMLLVDGGLVANIPSSVARESGSDFVIAINSTSPLHSKTELELPWNIADQIVSIPMQKLTESQLQHTDYLIKPEISINDGFAFKDLIEVIEAGYNSTLPLVKEIKTSINNFYKSKFCDEDDFIGRLTPHENATKLELMVIEKLNKKDSLTIRDLYLELSSLTQSGSYSKINFVITSDSTKTNLRVNSLPTRLVEKVSILNNDEYINSKTNNCLQKLVGQNYNAKKILNCLLVCLRSVRKDGYSLIDVEKIEFDEQTGNLEFTFTDGIIDDIILTGNTKTGDDIILRELPLQRNQLFRYEALHKGLTNLRSTNLFEEIETLLVREGRRNALHLKVKERQSQLIRFGFRIDNEKQTQATIDIRDENFLGSGTEIAAIVSGGQRNRSIIFEHKANRIFDTYLTYKLRAFHGFDDVYTYENFPSGSESKFIRKQVAEYRHVFSGASFSLGKQVQKLGNLIAEMKYQKDIINNKIDYTGSTYSMDLFSLKFNLNIDTQDEFPYPTIGLKINSYYETAQTLLAGDIGYSKFSINYEGFVPLNSDMTLSPRFELGVGDETLPLGQQFSFGGQNSFFGFRDHEYMGRQLFITSLEFRYKLPINLFFKTFIKARYDLGSIWSQPEDIKFKDFKHGVGLTLSLDTPIGPADFSVGKGFILKDVTSSNAISWGETLFYFTIGYYY